MIPPSDEDPDFPIELTEKSEKNEENLINIVEMTPYNPPDPTHVIEYDQEILAADHPQAELLRLHNRPGHLPFSTLIILTMLGIIPKKFTTVKLPKCMGCIYRASTKSPWRTKGKQSPKRSMWSPRQDNECPLTNLSPYYQGS